MHFGARATSILQIWCSGHLAEHQEVAPVCIVIGREAFEAEVHWPRRTTIVESTPYNSLNTQR